MNSLSLQRKPDQDHNASSLRAPETILKLPVGPKFHVWSFGCLAFELLTGHSLVVLSSLFLEDAPNTIDDEHLIKLPDVMGRLPDRLFSSWRRGSKYFGPDGERLIVAE